MASRGQVFGAPQVSGSSPLTTDSVWLGVGGVATATATNGTGSPARVNTPTLITPVLGAATATSINFGGATLSTYTATTWTPAIGTDATSGTPAYTDQVGSYEQIGRQVTARFRIRLSGWTGSPTGNVQINGLPVASSNTANDTGVCFGAFYGVTGLAALNYGISGLITPGTSSVILFQSGTAGSISITAAQAGTTFFIIGMCNYHV